MQFAELAAASAAVAATTGRKAKVEILAGCLRRLAGCGDPRVVTAGAAFLAGEPLQRRTGVGWASLRQLPPAAGAATLTVAEVDAAFTDLAALSGPGAGATRTHRLERLLAAATAPEQRMIAGLLLRELRQGAQAGLLADAVAAAAAVPAASVRRALLLAGDLTAVACAALTGGAAALAAFGLRVGRPLAPMLAASAPTTDAALDATGTPAVADTKIDGVRVQVHRDGTDVAVFSRSLDDLTARLPTVVAAAAALPAGAVVLDGEVVGVDAAGRPVPFQETSGRAARRSAGTAGGDRVLLLPYFFDLLHLDGTDLLDEPGHGRWSALDSLVPRANRVARVPLAGDAAAPAAAAAFAAALRAGHEGLVVKSATAGYSVGRRGSAWVKVKPRHTLDLVVLAAEWGSGRRTGSLSNLHLGARDPAGGFVMLGKTFKGLTDAVLRWQTDRLLALAVERGDWVVRVRPELVVEIAFDGVQTSPRYPGGVALRFARVVRYREDKSAGEADTIETVRALLPVPGQPG